MSERISKKNQVQKKCIKKRGNNNTKNETKNKQTKSLVRVSKEHRERARQNTMINKVE